MKRKTTEHAHLVRDVAICVPAIRSVVVFAYWDDDGVPFHEIHPVLAIQTCVKSEYVARRDGDRIRPRGDSHEEMVSLGWKLEYGPAICFQAVIADSEYGMVAHDDDELLGFNRVTEIVPCPWSPDLDRDNLAAHVGRLMRRAATQAFARSGRAVVSPQANIPTEETASVEGPNFTPKEEHRCESR